MVHKPAPSLQAPLGADGTGRPPEVPKPTQPQCAESGCHSSEHPAGEGDPASVVWDTVERSSSSVEGVCVCVCVCVCLCVCSYAILCLYVGCGDE